MVGGLFIGLLTFTLVASFGDFYLLRTLNLTPSCLNAARTCGTLTLHSELIRGQTPDFADLMPPLAVSSNYQGFGVVAQLNLYR